MKIKCLSDVSGVHRAGVHTMIVTDNSSRSVMTHEQQLQKRDAPNMKRSIPRNRNLASAATEVQIRNSPFVEHHDINTMTPSFINV
jgi:hypothetical protein